MCTEDIMGGGADLESYRIRDNTLRGLFYQLSIDSTMS